MEDLSLRTIEPNVPDFQNSANENLLSQNLETLTLKSDSIEALKGSFFSNLKTSEVKEKIHRANQKLSNKTPLSNQLLNLETLGSGAFGTVSKIFDNITRTFYAEKVIRKAENSLKQFNHIFFRELVSVIYLIEIDNPNLLQIYSVDYKPQEEFKIVMECGMGSLRDMITFISKRKIIYPDVFESLQKDLLQQLEILSYNHVCHRDIKSDNIIVTKNMRFKFADFGLSEKFSANEVQKIDIVGTLGYMHPALEYAFKQDLHQVEVNPFEADEYSLKRVFTNFKSLIESSQFELVSQKEFEEKFQDEVMLNIFKDLDNYDKKMLIKQMMDAFILEDLFKRLKTELESIQSKDLNRNQELNVLQDLGKTTFLMGEFSTSLEYFESCLNLAFKLYSPDDIKMARYYDQIGRCYYERTMFKEALGNFTKSLQILEKNSDKIDPLTKAEYYENIGNCHTYLDNEKEGLKFLKDSLDLREKNEFLIATSLLNLGNFYTIKYQYEKAEKFLLDSLSLKEKNLIGNHPDLGESYNSLGYLYSIRRKNETALGYFLKALDIKLKFFSEYHPDVIRIMCNLGQLYMTMGNLEEALKYLEKVIQNGLKRLENNNEALLNSLTLMTLIFSRNKEFPRFTKFCDTILNQIDQSNFDDKSIDFSKRFRSEIENQRKKADKFKDYYTSSSE